MRRVYLDNNATTQLAPEVVEAMQASLMLYGNASSMHGYGRESNSAIEEARSSVARMLNCGVSEVIFTSGGSEGNNAVISFARELIDEGSKRNRIVTSVIEHPAIIEPCEALQKKGYKVDYVKVDKYGRVDLEAFKDLMGDDVLLVSIMAGNNETGTIQDIEAITKISKAAGALVHTDAVQAIGKMAVDVKKWGVDYLSLSGHKFYGPKGIGALYIRRGAPFKTFMKGGHQEEGRRAGTYSTTSIVGLGRAADLVVETGDKEAKELWVLREKLRKGLENAIEDTHVNGHPQECLPGTLNISFGGIEGESILLMLDFDGIAVSTGSACATGSLEPSYVLLAADLPVELAHGSIRFSLGRYNTEEEIDYVLEKMPPIVKRLREISTI
ncbi:MAG: aminotransferase class V-fold PLP-dependent enzyme [Sphaerochaetaceae bacterium]